MNVKLQGRKSFRWVFKHHLPESISAPIVVVAQTFKAAQKEAEKRGAKFYRCDGCGDTLWRQVGVEQDVYPGFARQYGRLPIPGVDFDPDGDLCQDDYEYLHGEGHYY